MVLEVRGTDLKNVDKYPSTKGEKGRVKAAYSWNGKEYEQYLSVRGKEKEFELVEGNAVGIRAFYQFMLWFMVNKKVEIGSFIYGIDKNDVDKNGNNRGIRKWKQVLCVENLDAETMRLIGADTCAKKYVTDKDGDLCVYVGGNLSSDNKVFAKMFNALAVSQDISNYVLCFGGGSKQESGFVKSAVEEDSSVWFIDWEKMLEEDDEVGTVGQSSEKNTCMNIECAEDKRKEILAVLKKNGWDILKPLGSYIYAIGSSNKRISRLWYVIDLQNVSKVNMKVMDALFGCGLPEDIYTNIECPDWIGQITNGRIYYIVECKKLYRITVDGFKKEKLFDDVNERKGKMDIIEFSNGDLRIVYYSDSSMAAECVVLDKEGNEIFSILPEQGKSIWPFEFSGRYYEIEERKKPSADMNNKGLLDVYTGKVIVPCEYVYFAFYKVRKTDRVYLIPYKSVGGINVADSYYMLENNEMRKVTERELEELVNLGIKNINLGLNMDAKNFKYINKFENYRFNRDGSLLHLNAKFCSNCGTKVQMDKQDNKINEDNVSKDCRAKGYDSYWSKLYHYGSDYGKSFQEYKGVVYCFVPEWALKNVEYLDTSMAQNWLLVGFDLVTGRNKILKTFFNVDGMDGYSFRGSYRERGFTIFDDKLYYSQDNNDSDMPTTKIYCIDLVKGEETEETVKRKTPDDRLIGFFKGRGGDVRIISEYDYDKEEAEIFASSENGGKKISVGINCKVALEAYNEEYVYYMLDDSLYCLNMETFKITNLSRKLSKMDELSYHGIDAKRNYVYFTDDKAVKALNLNNEIVEEIPFPTVALENGGKKMPHFNEGLSSRGESNIFFNGEYWIVKINPENVSKGEKEGVIIYSKTGMGIGRWMRIKDNAYIAINVLHFMLPSAFLVNYEIVDDNKRHRDFGSTPQGQWHWNARMICVENGALKDAKVVFHRRE